MVSKQLIFVPVLLYSVISVSMEEHPKITFFSHEQVLQSAEPLPEQYTQTATWIAEHADIFHALEIPYVENHNEFAQFKSFLQEKLEKMKLTSLSKNNFIFDTGDKTVVRYAGVENRLRSKASTVGIDSGPTQTMMEKVQEPHGDVWKYKSDVLQKATAPDSGPTFQHTSMLAYYQLMKKMLNGKKIQPLATWAVCIGDKPLCDDNYVIVQPKLPAGKYSRLDDLMRNNPQLYHTIVNESFLSALADAIDAGMWDISAGNIFYNSTDDCFYIGDFEKPNNEGWGPESGKNPRWGTAILSYKGDGESCHPWKWRHNMRYGYDKVREAILADQKELQERWDELRNIRCPKD